MAEWALVEAVLGLKKDTENVNSLHLYRSSNGEAEAYIDSWIEQNASNISQVFILSDDTDFLIYPSCPGFVPFKSISFEEQNGRFCMQGQHYLRAKFISSFLSCKDIDSTKLMSAISAIAGCDYVLDKDNEHVLSIVRKKMVESDIGGLRPKLRNNPTAAATLTAILRVVSYHATKATNNWMESMLRNLIPNKVPVAMKALTTVYEIYTNTLKLPPNLDSELMAGIVDVRRLLEYGVFFCVPVLETWNHPSNHGENVSRGASRKRNLEERMNPSRSGISPLVEVVRCPPTSTQMTTWKARGTIWNMPHFQQIRKRLYKFVSYAIGAGIYPPQLIVGDLWKSNQPITIQEYVRSGTGTRIFMMERPVTIANEMMMITTRASTKSLVSNNDLSSLDHILLSCVLGDDCCQVNQGTCHCSLPKHRELFLASLTLPFHLAFLLILMGTAPSFFSFEEENDIPSFSYSEISNDLNRILPVLSVACHHALVLVQMLNVIFQHLSKERTCDPYRMAGTDQDGSRRTVHSYQPFVVSTVFQKIKAGCIWHILQQHDYLMEIQERRLTSQQKENNLVWEDTFLEDVFDKLAKTLSIDSVSVSVSMSDEAWSQWKDDAQRLCTAWWEAFDGANHPIIVA